MQYTDSLPKHYSMYALQAKTDYVSFLAYRDDTASSADPETTRTNEELNSFMRGYFMRKGFSYSLALDPEVMTPFYKNLEGEVVTPKFPDAISKGEISGFRFNPKATMEQREETLKELISIFVDASQNADLATSHNHFMINISNDILLSGISYNNGGAKKPDLREIHDILGLTDEEMCRRSHLRAAIKTSVANQVKKQK